MRDAEQRVSLSLYRTTSARTAHPQPVTHTLSLYRSLYYECASAFTAHTFYRVCMTVKRLRYPNLRKFYQAHLTSLLMRPKNIEHSYTSFNSEILPIIVYWLKYRKNSEICLSEKRSIYERTTRQRSNTVNNISLTFFWYLSIRSIFKVITIVEFNLAHHLISFARSAPQCLVSIVLTKLI